jgi:hypothetical protein
VIVAVSPFPCVQVNTKSKLPPETLCFSVVSSERTVDVAVSEAIFVSGLLLLKTTFLVACTVHHGRAVCELVARLNGSLEYG